MNYIERIIKDTESVKKMLLSSNAPRVNHYVLSAPYPIRISYNLPKFILIKPISYNIKINDYNEHNNNNINNVIEMCLISLNASNR